MSFFVSRRKWAQTVKKRDGYRCIYCGAREKIEAHHIKQRAEYLEGALDIENGVTLCHRCHYTAHGGDYTTNHFTRYGTDRGFSCSPEGMNNYILKYVENVKGYIPTLDTCKTEETAQAKKAAQAQKNANKKWDAENLDWMSVALPKGAKDTIKAHAAAMGESVNAFFNRAALEQIQRDRGSEKTEAATETE